MKDRIDNTPIACSLATVELRDREATLLAQFRSAVVETKQLQDGYAFCLPGDGKWIELIAELIVAERECCPFLALEMAALTNMGPVIVQVTGPAGAKEFLTAVLCKAGASTWRHSGPNCGPIPRPRRSLVHAHDRRIGLRPGQYDRKLGNFFGF